MDRIFFGLAVFLLVLLGAPKAFADKFNTETSSEARALGMGNAVLGHVRGGHAAFYNPALLAAKDTGSVFQLANFQLEASKGLIQRGVATDSVNILTLADLYSSLLNNPGTWDHGRISFYPNMTIRNLSFGLLYEINRDAGVRPSDNALLVKARDRFAPVASLAFRLFGGILRFGASVQYMTVGNADSILLQPVDTDTLHYDNVINAGSGLNTTGGITVALPFRYLPTFSVVARNIGGTRFKGTPFIKFGEGRSVADVPMTFDLSFAATVYVARRLEMKVGIDYRDYVNKLQGQRFSHVFSGADFLVYDLLRFRGGYMHGYPTAGFGIHTRKADLDFAWYSEELDDRLRANRDQRFVLQYRFNFLGRTR